jgi:hypothetical protein
MKPIKFIKNATTAANLKWDEPVIMEVVEFQDIDIEKWGVELEAESGDNADEHQHKRISNNILVECESSGEQEQLFYELQGRGYKVSLK